MKDTDWVLGDMVWAIVATAVVLGLMAMKLPAASCGVSQN